MESEIITIGIDTTVDGPSGNPFLGKMPLLEGIPWVPLPLRWADSTWMVIRWLFLNSIITIELQYMVEAGGVGAFSFFENAELQNS
jgi:hypothetical protein